MMTPNNKLLRDLLIANIASLSTQKWDNLPSFNKQQNVMLYFVCGFTCSRCWRGVIILGQVYHTLQAHDTTVLVIGSGPYLRPAAELAAEFKLPFSFVVDKNGAFHREYSLCQPDLHQYCSTVVLIDKDGEARHIQKNSSPYTTFDKNLLITAVVSVNNSLIADAVDDKPNSIQQGVENRTAATRLTGLRYPNLASTYNF